MDWRRRFSNGTCGFSFFGGGMRGVYDGCARITWGLFILPQPLFTQLEAHLKFGTNSFFGERIARGKSKWSTPIRLSNIKALPFDSFCRRYDAEILHIIPDLCIISSMLFISCVVYATTVHPFCYCLNFCSSGRPHSMARS